MPDSADYDLDSYHYELEPELIAQHPKASRTESRLLVLDKKSGRSELSAFKSLGDYLTPGSLLVANNTRVLPARLVGRKETGGKVEFLLLTPLPLIEPVQGKNTKKALVECLLKSSRRPRPGEQIHFSHGVSFKILENSFMGKALGELYWTDDLARYFIENGRVPLPPYIQRPDEQSDHDRYQTVYSSDEKLGSVAAPTAGLHFSPGFRENLIKSGFGWTEVTLYVGYGTFSPVRVKDIREHKMHPEYIEVTDETAGKIFQAKAAGKKITAVGTTTARTLESLGVPQENTAGYRGFTDLFIYPGYRFRVVDQLITNFHLPGSSLMMMVSALAGRENILKAYQKARKEKFRFFSYGDAMLII
jgi:S-adenosylmethionine:tRNA ribosyltransferase-isomerase